MASVVETVDVTGAALSVTGSESSRYAMSRGGIVRFISCKAASNKTTIRLYNASAGGREVVQWVVNQNGDQKTTEPLAAWFPDGMWLTVEGQSSHTLDNLQIDIEGTDGRGALSTVST